jgi:hypothetical protein
MLPKLRLLHPPASLRVSSLRFWRRHTTEQIVNSLRAGSPYGELLVKVDGTVMGGNTRIFILMERGFDVESIARVPYP